MADDQAQISVGPRPLARAPERLRGLLELRGVGIVKLPYLERAPIHLVVDMDAAPPIRMPDPSFRRICDHQIPQIVGKEVPNLAAAVLVFLKSDGLIA